MMCGGETTHALSAVCFVANGSVLLAPRSPLSMYAMPVPVICGSFLLIHASPHACHCLSMHIGSSTDAAPNSDGELGKQTQPLVPARSCFGAPLGVSGQSMIVALRLISAGAALIALAILRAADLLAGAAFAPSIPAACWCCAASGKGTTEATATNVITTCLRMG